MSQTDIVLKHLEHEGPLTPKQAMNLYGIYRLGARVYDLRMRGHNIRRDMVKVRSRGGSALVARYSLS